MSMAKRSSFRRLSTGKDENFEDFDIKVSPMLLKVYPVLTRGIVHRDHPFKTSASFRGEGIKNLPNLPTDNSKKLPTVGG